ncbi:MAG: DUF2169 domain-containing protein [Litoreibacter sp.]
MRIDNETGYSAGFTAALDSDGRDHVVVVVKGSFDLQNNSGIDRCRRSDVQDALIMSDIFWGKPGFSAPRTEMDFAHVKPNCDILFEATAYAPDRRPATQLTAGAQLGRWKKAIEVIGDRVWLSGPTGPRISKTQSFTTMPVTYELAFGGVDRSDPTEELPAAYGPNPVGQGWHKMDNLAHLTGQPLHNFETPGDTVVFPWDNATAVGLGPMARGWPARLKYGGTYDQHWIDNVFPFLPADFDPRYYQAAPQDQQLPYPQGGEAVTLINLTSEGKTSFCLPDAEMPVLFSRRRADDISLNAPLDTIVIRPDARRINLTWRVSIPLQRDIFEVTECIIGKRSRAFWRARKLGKTYYPTLKALPQKVRAL